MVILGPEKQGGTQNKTKGNFTLLVFNDKHDIWWLYKGRMQASSYCQRERAGTQLLNTGCFSFGRTTQRRQN